MAMRLQELHPSLVHYPLTFFPLALVADTLGKVTGSRTLLRIGKWGIGAAAVSAAAAGVAGLIAQESVNVEGPTEDLLVTHRNLNLGFISVATAMAVQRSFRRAPTARYLGLGFAALGGALFAAYLGGHMVYEHGVGVRAARGVREEDAPILRPTRAREITRHAIGQAEMGLRRMVDETRHGRIMPALAHVDAPEDRVH